MTIPSARFQLETELVGRGRIKHVCVTIPFSRLGIIWAWFPIFLIVSWKGEMVELWTDLSVT